MTAKSNLKSNQLYLLTLLRVLLGWYFLYEGIVKFLDPNWSAYAYLKNATGLFSISWSALADNDSLLQIVDFLNIWGLIAIGLGLILGCFSRVASLSGALLAMLYYLSYPPTVTSQNFQLSGDHVLWVDKNLIFAVTLLVLFFFPTGKYFGIDRLIFKKKNTTDEQQ